MKYLIVNGDDFGASQGINRGILEAHRDGILTSASLFVDRPGSAEAAELAHATPLTRYRASCRPRWAPPFRGAGAASPATEALRRATEPAPHPLGFASQRPPVTRRASGLYRCCRRARPSRPRFFESPLHPRVLRSVGRKNRPSEHQRSLSGALAENQTPGWTERAGLPPRVRRCGPRVRIRHGARTRSPHALRSLLAKYDPRRRNQLSASETCQAF
jgi:hypothetical protein